MLKKYVMLQDKIDHWDVFREQYYKIIKEIRMFEEDEAPEGWYLFITLNERPEIPEGQYLCHHYEFKDNILYRNYFLVDSKDDLRLYGIKDYESEVQKFLDETVQKRGYDNVYTCISYKGDPDPIFAAEAEEVLAWRSRVWRTAQSILNDWDSGEIEKPTVKEVIDRLPKLDW